MELLECKQLSKMYDGKIALQNVNLTIPRGKIIGLLGKNGSGKTTLIKLINDLFRSDFRNVTGWLAGVLLLLPVHFFNYRFCAALS